MFKFEGNKIHILGIDWQNDFCDPKGSLYVGGADEDAIRFAKLVKKLSLKLEDIHMTLDTHHRFDIAHPMFWRGSKGQHPSPFTIITVDDVQNGIWRASVPSMQPDALNYVTKLAEHARYPLCIWPEHCLIGSWGHNILPSVWDAISEWENRPAFVDYVTKGSNFLTEHYSAVMADVEDPTDASTQLNTGLIRLLQEASDVLITGQAKSHCVANTVRDIADNFGDDNLKKLVIIEDCMSSVGNPPGGVPDFQAMGEQFVADMKARGLRVAKSTDF